MLKLANADIDGFRWENGEDFCVTLTYDDGSTSHLETVVPLLGTYGLQASFYPILDRNFLHRLEAWRGVATQGHELGHHMITHAVRKYNRDGEMLRFKDWVNERFKLELYSLRRWRYEMWLGDRILCLATNRRHRTFTFPANERFFNTPNGIVFLENDINRQFKGVRAFESTEPITSRHLCFGALPHIGGNANPSETIISRIEGYQRKHLRPWYILNFHDFADEPNGLTTTVEEHEKLLGWLAENRSRIAVMTVADAVMHLIRGQRETVRETTATSLKRRLGERVYGDLLERYLRDPEEDAASRLTADAARAAV